MVDQTEVEIKLILDDAPAMRQKIVELGGRSRGQHAEINVRLDDTSRSLSMGGSLLRLRYIESDFEKHTLVTVKTPTAGEDTIFRARREIEFTVSEPDSMAAAFEVLGYMPIWRYEKRRETFELTGAEIALDETPLGTFMEIEGEEASIQAAANLIGMDVAAGSLKSYSELFACVKERLSLPMDDLTFEAFAGFTVNPDDIRACL
ncbi:MAG: CYTH domain-containing protein [Anaerolineae bacterium]